MKREYVSKKISPKKILHLIFILLFIPGCGEQKIDQATIRNDIEFVTKTITENHPGPYNTLDPEFMTQLATAHQETLKNAVTVKTMREYNALIKAYMDHFHDSHLNFAPKNPTEKRTVQKNAQDISLKDFDQNSVWITIPTFDPDSKQKKQFKNLITQLPTLRNKDTLIFDVRGNTGGNSSWAYQLIQALFGELFAEKKIKTMRQKIFVDWRASKKNTNYMCEIAQEWTQEFGEQSEESRWAHSVCNGMRASLKKGDPFFCDSGDRENPDTIPDQANQCSAKIIVLIDHLCGSATLDFIDYLKSLDYPLLLVGKTTGADALYIDVRSEELPSHLGTLVFPMKVYRNRPRGNNEPYHPDIEYPGDIKDTYALEQWLIQNVIHKIISQEKYLKS